MQVAVGQLEWVQQCIGAAAAGPFHFSFGKHLKPQASRTVVWVGAQGPGLLGWLSFSDTVRSDAAEVVRSLQRMGLGVLLLSGDAPSAVARIADEVGIPQKSRWGSPDSGRNPGAFLEGCECPIWGCRHLKSLNLVHRYKEQRGCSQSGCRFKRSGASASLPASCESSRE